MVKNDFGDANVSQILFSENVLIVAAFAISAVIAFVGAFFFLQLFYILGKSVRVQYEKFLIG